MKISIMILLLLLYVGSACSQWVQQPSPTTHELDGIKFFNDKYGIIAGSEVILTSNDSGNTWNLQEFPNWYLGGCDFQSRDSIWVVGGTLPYQNLIIKSTNGGLNWNVIDTSGANSICQAVFFKDQLHGWICGGETGAAGTGWIRRTINGGETWQEIDLDSSFITDVFFVNTLDGWATSEFGQLYKSTDGGQSWNLNIRIGNQEPMRKIFFTTVDSGWSVGGISGDQIIARTTDAGIDWTVEDTSINGSSLHGLWFTDSQNGWTVGGANSGLKILRTTNGGVSWLKQEQPLPPFTISYFESVYMLNSMTGFVVGDSGVILKTTNGGLSDVNFESFNTPKKFELYQNYPNPFNPSTVISYSIPNDNFITLRVFDALGREIKTLVNGYQRTGKHSVTFKAENLPSGVYFYRLEAGNFSKTKKLVLLR
jgi:photosystem II stability/assembly factor-like uncharacterized protein